MLLLQGLLLIIDSSQEAGLTSVSWYGPVCLVGLMNGMR